MLSQGIAILKVVDEDAKNKRYPHTTYQLVQNYLKEYKYASQDPEGIVALITEVYRDADGPSITKPVHKKVQAFLRNALPTSEQLDSAVAAYNKIFEDGLTENLNSENMLQIQRAAIKAAIKTILE